MDDADDAAAWCSAAAGGWRCCYELELAPLQSLPRAVCDSSTHLSSTESKPTSPSIGTRRFTSHTPKVSALQPCLFDGRPLGWHPYAPAAKLAVPRAGRGPRSGLKLPATAVTLLLALPGSCSSPVPANRTVARERLSHRPLLAWPQSSAAQRVTRLRAPCPGAASHWPTCLADQRPAWSDPHPQPARPASDAAANLLAAAVVAIHDLASRPSPPTHGIPPWTTSCPSTASTLATPIYRKLQKKPQDPPSASQQQWPAQPALTHPPTCTTAVCPIRQATRRRALSLAAGKPRDPLTSAMHRVPVPRTLGSLCSASSGAATARAPPSCSRPTLPGQAAE